MELKSLNCPKCGAVIEAEDGLEIFFCKYCGNKIILAEQSDAAYDAKVRMHENTLKYHNEKEKQNQDHIITMIVWIMLAAFGLLGFIILIIAELKK